MQIIVFWVKLVQYFQLYYWQYFQSSVLNTWMLLLLIKFETCCCADDLVYIPVFLSTSWYRDQDNIHTYTVSQIWEGAQYDLLSYTISNCKITTMILLAKLFLNENNMPLPLFAKPSNPSIIPYSVWSLKCTSSLQQPSYYSNLSALFYSVLRVTMECKCY